MNDITDKLEDLIAELKEERDEVRLKIGLAKLEAADEWRDIEHKLGKLEGKAKQVGAATADASKDVGAAAKLLGEEIRKGLKGIVSRMK